MLLFSSFNIYTFYLIPYLTNKLIYIVTKLKLNTNYINMNESYFDDIKININEFQQNEDFSVDDLMFALENEEHTNLIDMTPEKLEDIKPNAIVTFN